LDDFGHLDIAPLRLPTSQQGTRQSKNQFKTATYKKIPCHKPDNHPLQGAPPGWRRSTPKIGQNQNSLPTLRNPKPGSLPASLAKTDERRGWQYRQYPSRD
jgi:hypothetical protein